MYAQFLHDQNKPIFQIFNSFYEFPRIAYIILLDTAYYVICLNNNYITVGNVIYAKKIILMVGYN